MSARKDIYSSSRPSLEYLMHRGPHSVVAGDLDSIGIRGIVFAPHTGPRCPAVVFGHGYLQPAARYANTLRFLASWGFVAAAPDTERSPLPSHRGLALDLSRTADRLADAKLHNGRVTVDAQRIALVGHGIGGGAAVLAAAAGRPKIQAVATLFAAPTSPSAVRAAADVTCAGMHIIGSDDDMVDEQSGGAAIARAWGGPVQLRRIRGAQHLSIAEGKHLTSRLLGQQASRSTLRTVRAALAAFLLVHIAQHEYLADELGGAIATSKLVELETPTAS